MADASGASSRDDDRGDALTWIYLVRHGQTFWNADKRLQGNTDSQLNGLGLAQATAAGKWLAAEPAIHPDTFGIRSGLQAPPPMPFTAVYSSDLSRASTTAARIAEQLPGKDLPVRQDPRFREINLGIIEGCSWREAGHRFSDIVAAYNSADDGRIPGGETHAERRARVVDGLRSVAAAHPGEKVVLVTHGGTLSSIFGFITGNSSTTSLNASINIIAVSREGLETAPLIDSSGDGTAAGASSGHVGDGTADASGGSGGGSGAVSGAGSPSNGTFRASESSPDGAKGWFVYCWALGEHLAGVTPEEIPLPATPEVRKTMLGPHAEDIELLEYFRILNRDGCQKEASVVIPEFLYLSGADWVKENSAQLERMNVRLVVNVAGSEIKSSVVDGVVVNYPREEMSIAGIELLEVDMDDTTRFCEGHDVPEMLSNIVDSIERLWTAGTGRVLVHCSAGQSRSAAAVAAYVMKWSGWSLRRTLLYLRCKRRFTYPGPGFLKALCALEARWQEGKHSIDPTIVDALHRSSPTSIWNTHPSEDDQVKQLMEVCGLDTSSSASVSRARDALSRAGGNVSVALGHLMGVDAM